MDRDPLLGRKTPYYSGLLVQSDSGGPVKNNFLRNFYYSATNRRKNETKKSYVKNFRDECVRRFRVGPVELLPERLDLDEDRLDVDGRRAVLHQLVHRVKVVLIKKSLFWVKSLLWIKTKKHLIFYYFIHLI